MKKFFSMVVMMLAVATAANAQFVNSSSNNSSSNSNSISSEENENYSRFYLGYSLFSANDFSKDALNGFTFGFAQGINVTGHNLPIYLEVGAEMNWTTYDYEYAIYDGRHYDSKKESGNMFGIAIPINVAYKIQCGESISLTPYLGPNLRFNILNEAGDYDFLDSDDANRFQFGWNVGLGVNFNHFYLGYRFTTDFTEIAKGCDGGNFNNFFVGVSF